MDHLREYDAARGTAAERGYASPKWRALCARVKREEPFCRKGCGRRTTDVDHIVPKRRGGKDERSNLQGLCKSCHSAKTLAENRR